MPSCKRNDNKIQIEDTTRADLDPTEDLRPNL